MKRNYWYLLFLISGLSFAQDKAKDILFTIDNQSFSSEEFSRVYKKNIELVKDESQKDVDKYLDLYISYKLKVDKAFDLGLHEKQQYKNELNSYRSQLSQKYLLDKEVTQKMIEEAYNRMRLEVNTSHILINLDQYAAPEDTLKVYNRLVEIKKRVEKGEDFGVLAKQYSEDPSAKTNEGKLGYFTVFKMVYPFENKAYTTNKGGVSNPFRTKFGYHIVKVDDVRLSRGKVSVSHIMLFKKKNDTTKVDLEDKINDIYSKLKQGESFESLASMYSEDSGSSKKGGLLDTFGTGDIGSEVFEDVAFGLESPKDFSEPFETKYGWHIILLNEKISLEPFDKIEDKIKYKVLQDDRSSVIKNSLTEKLESKYKIKVNSKKYKAVAKRVNDDFYIKSWKLPEDVNSLDETLFTMDSIAVSEGDFLKFINAQQNLKIGVKPVSRLVDYLFEKYKKEQLNLYYSKNLENEIPEFKAVMTEYKEGILLFDLMSEKVWNQAKKDTLGLKTYYESHKKYYMWEDRLEIKIASSTDKKVIEKVKKYLSKDKEDSYIKEKVNKDNQVNVMLEEGTFEKSSKKIPNGYVYSEGVSSIIKDGDYYFVVVGQSFKPASPKELEETKGQVISDYQQYLEKNWIASLKKESKVEVNQEVLIKIKKELK